MWMSSDQGWEYRAFVIKHSYNVKPLLLAYSHILTEAVDLVWEVHTRD